uniref:Uncharacterized protein n=1 Tax=Arion vulgaris TaxID=1028688 RepID=A0A0B7AKR6_9EUPU
MKHSRKMLKIQQIAKSNRVDVPKEGNKIRKPSGKHPEKSVIVFWVNVIRRPGLQRIETTDKITDKKDRKRRS